MSKQCNRNSGWRRLRPGKTLTTGTSCRTGTRVWILACLIAVAWGLPSVIAAVTGSGGNTTNEVGGFRYHTFTNSGSFSLDETWDVDILVVAGGGGGSSGGGGAGGLIHIAMTSLVANVSYPVTVGVGGAGKSVTTSGESGGNSSFSNLTAIGGGGGRQVNTAAGLDGGSGGGGGAYGAGTTYGGFGIAGQGHDGRGNNGLTGSPHPSGGGGGAGGPGYAAVSSSMSGAGGVGREITNFTAVAGSPAGWFAGGGGGACYGGGGYGDGGSGGGGSGGAPGVAGDDGTGGGGGGAINGHLGGNGGSGIVIVRYSLSSEIRIQAFTPTHWLPNQGTLSGRLAGDGGDSDTLIALCVSDADAGTDRTNDWTRVISLGEGWQRNQAFDYLLDGLQSGSSYVYRAYATNTTGDAWSEPVEFTVPVLPSVDVDGFRYYTYTNSGTFYLDETRDVDILVVAGGGGGSSGGGGAGGLIHITMTTLVANVSYPITVGVGGAGKSVADSGESGGNSSFSNLTAIGGGGGQKVNIAAGLDGGSGGGGGAWGTGTTFGGFGIAGQGHDGSGNNGITGSPYPSGGGGGAGGPGHAPVSTSMSGEGGVGREITNFAAVAGSPAGWFAGGGGGARFDGGGYADGGLGGGGSGGAPGVAGDDGTGGGGGGARNGYLGGNGGSGIVIVRYSLISLFRIDAFAPTNRQPTQVTLNGRLAGDGGDGDTLIALCVSDADAGTDRTNDWTRVISLGDGWQRNQDFDYLLDGLHSGSSYVYRAYATNTAGEVWSEPVAFTAPALATVTNRGATQIGRTSARLNAEVTDTGADDPYCMLEYWVVGSASTTTVAVGVQDGWFATAIAGLSPSSDYAYRVSASNAAGTAWSDVRYFETLPLAPLDLFVATNGNDQSGLDWPNAYTNLQSALDLAYPGDSIHLAGHSFVIGAALTWPLIPGLTISGGYAATNTSGVGEYDIRRWPTVVRRDPSVNIRLLDVTSATNAIIERIVFRDGRTTESQGGAIRVQDAVNLTLRDCELYRNTVVASIPYGGGFHALNSSGTLENTRIRGNRVEGAANQWMYGAGLVLVNGAWTVRHSEITGNMAVGASTAGSGVYVSGGTHEFHNVLLALNKHSGTTEGAGMHIAGSATVLLANATIAAHGADGLYNTSPNVTLRNSILYGNLPDLAGAQTPALSNNRIGDDPLFAAPLFYLQPDSPCLDAGDRSVGDAGLTGRTSLTNGVADSGTVNLGYHFAEGLAIDQELYVSSDGNDGNTGDDPGQALRSITRALQVASAPRVRIHVAAGMYTNGVESFPLIISNRTVQLVGTNAATTVINASGSGARGVQIIDTTGDNRIEGITLRGANVSGLVGGGLHAMQSAFTLRRGAILDNLAHTSANSSGGGIYADGVSGLIDDSVIAGNTTTASSSEWAFGGGLTLVDGLWLFRHSIIAGNTADAGGGGGGGALLTRGTHRFHNVLLAANSGWGTFGGTHVFGGGALRIAAGTRVMMENTTVAANTPPAIRNDSAAANVTIRNSIFYNNVRDIEGTTPTLSHNSSGIDPRFEAPLYYLQPDSPCLNAGDRSVAEAGLTGWTSLADGTPDSGTVNLGFHYPAGRGSDVEFYVSPDGNDANDGSGPAAGQALRSITRAMQMPVPDRARVRIHLAAGTYPNGVETFPLVIDQRTVQLMGTNAALTVIDATGAGRRAIHLLHSFGDNRIEGLTVRGGDISGGHGGGLYVAAASLSLHDAIVRDNEAYMASAGAGGGLYAIRSVGSIRATRLEDNTLSGGAGVWATGGGGLALFHGSWRIAETVLSRNHLMVGGCRGGGAYFSGGDHELRNSLIVSNYYTSAYPASQAGAAVFMQRHSAITDSMALRLENCTISTHAIGAGGALQSSHDSDMTVYNTIIYGNTPADVVGLSNVRFFYSCSPGLTAGLQGNIIDDPLFVDPAAGNYLLQSRYGQYDVNGNLIHHAATSPCLDAGTNRAWMATATDLRGGARIVRGIPRSPGELRVDMGAYETQSPPAGTLFKFR